MGLKGATVISTRCVDSGYEVIVGTVRGKQRIPFIRCRSVSLDGRRMVCEFSDGVKISPRIKSADSSGGAKRIEYH